MGKTNKQKGLAKKKAQLKRIVNKTPQPKIKLQFVILD